MIASYSAAGLAPNKGSPLDKGISGTVSVELEKTWAKIELGWRSGLSAKHRGELWHYKFDYHQIAILLGCQG